MKSKLEINERHDAIRTHLQDKTAHERKDHRLHSPRQALLRIHERREQPRPEKLQRQTYEHRGDHQQRETVARAARRQRRGAGFQGSAPCLPRRKNTHRKDTKWNVSSHAAPTPHQCKAGLGVNPSGQKRFFSSWKAWTTASPTPCMTPQTRKRIFEPCPTARRAPVRDDQVQVAVPPAAPAKRDIQVVAEP